MQKPNNCPYHIGLAECFSFISLIKTYLLLASFKSGISGKKMLLKSLALVLSLLQTNLTNLGVIKVMVFTDEDGKLAYEDATHIYWAAFLALLRKILLATM